MVGLYDILSVHRALALHPVRLQEGFASWQEWIIRNLITYLGLTGKENACVGEDFESTPKSSFHFGRLGRSI